MNLSLLRCFEKSLGGLLAITFLTGFNWAEDLHPEARIRLLYDDLYESHHDISAPFLAARAGVFPYLTKDFHAGFELVTAGTDLDSRGDRVSLSGGDRSKSISISQAYMGADLALGEAVEVEGLAGKFEAPLLYSPLVWDSQIRPEGLLESVDVRLAPHLELSFFANQVSIDQVAESITNGTPLRRSWLFEEGTLAHYHTESETEILLGFNSYFFYDLSERVALASQQFGNTVNGTAPNLPSFRYHYAPVESVLQMSAYPLGIRAQLRGAFVINFRTPDKQRSFFAEGALGNPWKKGNFRTALSYYYNEPDTTLALLADPDYGSTNRKGPRVDVSYYPLDFFRLGAAFAYMQVFTHSTYQADRKELILDMEMKFF